MKVPMQIEPQIQTSGVDPVEEQTLPKEKEVVHPPLTKMTTDRLDICQKLTEYLIIQLDQK